MTDLFFYLSKIFWIVVQPDHLLLLILLFGLLLWRKLLGAFLVWTSVLTFMLISIFPVGNYLLRPLETRFQMASLPDDITGVVVLSGGEDAELSSIHDAPQFNEGAERLMVIPQLMLRYPQAKVIFTGGSGALLRPGYRGGDVAKKWLSQQGLGSRVIIDRDSRNTFQNAIYTRELIGELPEQEGAWLLVTSAFHMPRSIGVFRQQGMEMIPYPVDYRVGEDRFRPNFTRNMADLKTGVREWIGLLAYHLTDKTAELAPSPVPHQIGNE